MTERILKEISLCIKRGKLHPHDDKKERHDFAYGSDGKSFIIHKGNRIEYMKKIMENYSWFIWENKEENESQKCSEWKITINNKCPVTVIMTFMWFYCPPSEKSIELIYYLTDRLLFRYYHNTNKWRVLPDKSDNMRPMSSDFTNALNFFRGKRTDYDKHDSEVCHKMTECMLLQRIFLFKEDFTSMESTARELRSIMSEILEVPMKNKDFPKIPDIYYEKAAKSFRKYVDDL